MQTDYQFFNNFTAATCAFLSAFLYNCKRNFSDSVNLSNDSFSPNNCPMVLIPYSSHNFNRVSASGLRVPDSQYDIADGVIFKAAQTCFLDIFFCSRKKRKRSGNLSIFSNKNQSFLEVFNNLSILIIANYNSLATFYINIVIQFNFVLISFWR